MEPTNDAELASELGAQPGAASGDSARSLIITLLGEFVAPHGGRCWTQSLVAVMDELGVREKATRQAVARLHQRGWLSKERVGRKTRWELTDSTRTILTTGAERIYGFGRADREWDGGWLVLLARVPERERHVRHRMTTGLNWAGFGSIGQGVWLSPWTTDEPEAVRLLGDLGVEATSFRAELGSLGVGSDLVAQAWDLPGLRSSYERFMHDLASLAQPADGRAAAGQLALATHWWRRFPFADPDLPRELLPRDWPGPAAAKRYATVRAALGPWAAAWWTELDASEGPGAPTS